jgi:hypothetical protein
MKMPRFVVTLGIVLALSLSMVSSREARAEGFNLPTLDTSMIDPVFRTLASSFAFRPLEGATPLGKVWGLYIGIGGSGTDTSAVTSIFSNTKATLLPSADVQFGASFPKGITLEGALLPQYAYQGSSIHKYCGAVKWTFSQVFFPKVPLSVALRVGMANGAMHFSQPLDGGTVTVDYKTSVIESNLVVSKWLGGFGVGIEPYAGLGYAHQSTTLSGSGSANLFGGSFSSGTTSIDSGTGSVWLQAGMMLKLTVFAFTAEYDRIFNLNSYGGKISLRF